MIFPGRSGFPRVAGLGAVALCLLPLAALSLSGAATLPAGFKETQLASGINPSAMDFAPDGRLFWLEKNGRVRIVKEGKLLASPFLTLDVDDSQERGLLGVAIDPDFAASPFVYLYYTAKNPSHNRVSRFRAAGDTVTGKEEILIDLDNLTDVGWHNGGAIHFGKDGKLYIAAGNNTNNTYSQSLGALLGKILRLNKDGTIPSDNPFTGQTTGKLQAIWALGLRNPFTTAMHPTDGRFFINDVGEGGSEEIDLGTAGANYGWPKAEGHANTAPTGLIGAYVDPVSWYGHNGNCALTGGSFYHPPFNGFGAAYQDLYFYSDYCAGFIKSLDPATKTVKDFATGALRPIDIKAGPDGALYYLTRGNRAQGVSQGSADDNHATKDGGLWRIQGPNGVTSIGKPRIYQGLPSGWVARVFPGRSLSLPAGRNELRLYDIEGRLAWSWKRSGGANAVATVPADLGSGLYRAEFR
jgi:glucose/arabinose dehydrogenase